MQTPTRSKRVENIELKYPKMEEPPVAPKQSPPRLADLNTVLITANNYPDDMPRRSEIKKYNQSLEAFYEEYEDYLSKMEESEALNARKFELKIRLENPGTAPLESAVVFITIPRVVRLTRNDAEFKHPKMPSPPERPKPPKSLLESLGRWREPDRPIFHMPPRFNKYLEPPNIEGNAFESNEDDYRVSFRVRQATHNLVYECPYDIYAVFESLEGAQSFKIEWQIVAANLPRPVNGLLHVIVERTSAVGNTEKASR